MDYDQLREILVNTENLYNLWQSTGLSEETFIKQNKSLIIQTEKTRLAKISAKKRQEAFLEKKRAEGKRHLTAIVLNETFNKLCVIRDRAIQAGEQKSLGDVLDDLISNDRPAPTEKKVKEKELDLFNNDQAAPEPKTPPCDDIPERETPEYSDWLFNKIEPLKKAGMSSGKIEKKFNADGVKPYKKDKTEFGRGGVDAFFKGKLKKQGLKWDNALKQAVPLDKAE